MKRKLFLGVFLIFFLPIVSMHVYGQNRKLTDVELNNSTVAKITFADTARNCEEMCKWFKHDEANNTIFLFLQGGIAPVIHVNDKDFENKYKVYFWDFGCIAPDNKCVTKYNNYVFDYLSTIYGNKWRKEIRKDVIGFSEWKKNRQK